ncbi:Guanine nucleotide binding protein (G-protein), alpha subunit [Parasponia andersonii]|uniref:Guanine nucleotide binding protein (G-protein), alpha subunit n=1 Tax=Parasponia andersonii TaxID=3476 RepID=A0A2P5C7D9_PARAD|nr:Guanine nucleotide binding protein (G-protein), alpha subunit [Parasponia andersonii]
MAFLLRKLRPAANSSSVPIDENDEVFNVEYSIAMEYHGPPVTYRIPHAAPVEFDHIPTAAAAVAVVTSTALFPNSSIPVVQPILKKKSEIRPERETKIEQVIVDRSSSERLAGDSGDLRISGEIAGSGEESDEGFQNYMNPTNCESTESGLSSRSLSSEVFSHKEEEEEEEEECGGDTPHHVRRVSVVTFRDPDSKDVVEDEEWSESGEVEAVEERPKAVRTGKKGSCYRCNAGNRFTEKEVCLVCGAKYCSNCVLRAMGSMPEGRKCVSCIGYRIDESRRRKLGKCSRLLKKLISELEVDQIMKSELFCKFNQLPANLVFVNGEPLSEEELVRLQNCPNPPRKLKPGFYWYDNVSGFWGKEGQVYCEIISPQLNVGGRISSNASNGNTQIMINGRKINKVELRILQLAGVPCEGELHYWVNPDGSYQQEGMNNVFKGKIWDKVAVKLACAIFSLPIPSDTSNPQMEEKERPLSTPVEEKRLNKFLLIGSDQSGTSTIFKQAKFLYSVPFSEEERQNIKLMIQSKLYSYLGILLEGREKFEEESLFQKKKRSLINQPGPSGNTGQIEQTTIYSIGQRLKAFSDWLLNVMASGNLEAIFPAATREYAQFVEDLWNDTAIQATYNRRNELEMLPRNATYFLNRAVEISRTDYVPSDMDILYAEGIASSNSVASVEFCPKWERESMVDAPLQRDPLLRCQLIRVHPSSLGENCKWLQMFEDVDIILFCVSLSDYDEFFDDRNGGKFNKLMASKQLFESIVTHPSFEKKQFLLLLNKFDLLEEKIDRVPLSRCEWFQDFCPVISSNPASSSNNNTNSPTLAHRAFQYIAVKFKRHFHALTDRKLFVSLINGLESETVDEAIRYGGEILKWVEEKPKLIADQQVSSTSIEASSSS